MNKEFILSATAFFMLLCSYSFAQTLYLEDFEGEADGSVAGTAGGTIGGTWGISYGGSGTFSKQNVAVMGNAFLSGNTATEAVWSTSTVDISSAGYAVISIDIGSAFVEANDYIRCYYKIDGGAEILFYELIGGGGFLGLALENPASAIVAGDDLQIIIRVQNDRDLTGFCPFCAMVDDNYAFDNVTITAADILYSRKSGDWTDDTGGFGGSGTWSTNISGTPACGCIPLNDIVAIVQDGHTVTLAGNQTTIGNPPTTTLAPGAVDVKGILELDGNTLGIQQGLLLVSSGGVINSGGAVVGDEISFNAEVGGAKLQIDAGGSVSIQNLILTTEATSLHYLEGAGSLDLTGNISINGDNATLTNNMTTEVTVGGDLIFNEDNSTLLNNGTLTFTGDLIAGGSGDDGNGVTNSNGATLNFAGIDANDANFIVTNSGTINQFRQFYWYC